VVDGRAQFFLFVEPALPTGFNPLIQIVLRLGVGLDEDVVFVKL